MPDYFAAFLDLRGRRCLVVGGGQIGERKARALLQCGADVVVVSPVVTRGLAALAAAGRLVDRRRTFRLSDLRGCVLAIAASGDPAVDDAVAARARRARVLVNVVDRPERCDFILPSVLHRGELQIAVSTGGRSPALAREIRRRLETLFGPDYGELIARAGEARRAAQGGRANRCGEARGGSARRGARPRRAIAPPRSPTRRA